MAALPSLDARPPLPFRGAPAYWFRHLVSLGRADGARELMDLLDAVAEPLPDNEPEYG